MKDNRSKTTLGKGLHYISSLFRRGKKGRNPFNTQVSGILIKATSQHDSETKIRSQSSTHCYHEEVREAAKVSASLSRSKMNAFSLVFCTCCWGESIRTLRETPLRRLGHVRLLMLSRNDVKTWALVRISVGDQERNGKCHSFSNTC
jgi:hypothetical protein